MSKKRLDDVIHGDRAVVRQLTFSGNNHDKKNGGCGFEKKSGSGFDSYSGKSSGGKHSHHPRCYESHPGLMLPGTEFKVYGGSCGHPFVNDADIYIGFDHGMRFTARHWPWKKGTEIYFHVPDMGIPESADEYKKLVGWAKQQVDAGKKVHAGCIGGHGRTGMFLAALVSAFGEKNAIAYVRDHYCKKSVESAKQVNFLKEHFGVKGVAGSKTGKSFSSAKGSDHSGKFIATPIPGNGSIWGV